MKYRALLMAIMFYTILFLSCASDDSPTAGNGSGSENGNALVRGCLLNADGSPASNAVINVCPVNYIEGSSAKLDTAVTNHDGHYSIPSLSYGTYNLLGRNSLGLACLIDSVKVDKDTVIVRSAMLKPTGRLSGFVRLHWNDNPAGCVAVNFVGSYKQVLPDSSGAFSMDTLAEGRYNILITTSNRNYQSVDTSFYIQAGMITQVGTIVLPLKDTAYRFLSIRLTDTTGIDTGTNIATLKWPASDAVGITGYNVYRNLLGDSQSKLNVSPLPDSLYQDSTAISGLTYVYQIRYLDVLDIEHIHTWPDTITLP